jgi:two-component system, cell cycle sensor histidine kinase and response regulator CckA
MPVSASRILKYGLALVVSGAALLFRHGLVVLAGPGVPPFLTFYPAVMLVAILWGWGPGLLATGAAAVMAAYAIFPPVGRFALSRSVDVVALAFFLLLGGGMSVAAAFYHRVRVRADRYAQEFAALASRRQAEAAQARLAAIVESSEDAILSMDAAGTILTWNAGAERMLGYRAGEIIGQPVTRLLPGDPAPLGEPILQRLRRGESLPSFEAACVTKDGRRLAVSMTASPLMATGERVIGVSAILRDITPRAQAEAALQARLRLEERLSRLAAAAPGVMYLFRLHPDGTACFPYAGPAAVQIFGLRPETMTEDAAAVFRMVHPDDLPRVQASIQASARDLSPWRAEFRVRHPEKGEIWVEGRSTPERESDGSILWHGFAHDISGRKEAEQALQDSEERFRLAMAATTDGLWEWDVPTGRTYYSPAYVRMLGYTPEEFGTTVEAWASRLHPEDREQALAAGQACIDNRQPIYQAEFRLRAKAGTWRWILGRGEAATRDAGGRAIRMVGTHVDITDRKAAEQALRDSEARLSAIFHRSPLGIVMTRLHDGRIVDANAAFAALHGYTRDELLGRSSLELGLWATPAERDAMVARLRADGACTDLEIHSRTKEGALREVRISVELLELGGDRLTLGLAQDITERKRQAAALAARTQQLEAVRAISLEITRELNLTTLLELLVERAVRLVGAASGTCFLWDEARQRLIPHAWTGYGGWRAEIQARLGEGIAGQVALRRAGVTTADYQAEPYAMPEFLARQSVRAVMGEPLLYRDRLIGVLSIAHAAAERTFTSQDQALLRLFADQAAIAIENARLFAEQERAAGEARSLYEVLRESEEHARQLAQENALMAEIGRIVSATLQIDEIYEDFAARVKQVLPFDRMVISVLDLQKGTFSHVHMSTGPLHDRRVGTDFPLAGSGIAEVVRTRASFLLQPDDFQAYAERFPILAPTFEAGFRSLLHVPLFVKGELIGALLLRSRAPQAYAPADVRLAERIGAQIAGTIANAQLYAARVAAEEDRTALEGQYRQAQKMEAIGRLAGGVAHDFNNLLTVITGSAYMLMTELPAEAPPREFAAEIQGAAERAAALTRQLLAFSRKQVLEPKVLDLNDLLGALEKMLRRLIGEDITLSTVLAPGLPQVRVDPGQLEQVVLNLAVNARDAMPHGGRLSLRTRAIVLTEAECRFRPDCRPGAYVQLVVSDTGCGMPPEVQARIFEPFFTTKAPGKGTGLGLATVFGIVKQSDGHIEVESRVGRGTAFRLSLPAVAGSSAVPRPDDPASGGRETILLVEDEAAVRRIARLALEVHGYTVLEASDGPQAIEIADDLARPIQLLVTDIVMPGMNGRILAEQLRARLAALRVLFISGYTDDALAQYEVSDPDTAFLQKPFSPLELARKVREVLDRP